MNKKLLVELNKQIQEEVYSAHIYLEMAAIASSLKLPGFANWFEVQYREELDHALGFFHYLIERNETPLVSEIKKPKVAVKDAKSLFVMSLKHEKHITERIHLLMELATEVKDYPTVSFLKWYVDEQVEEEALAQGYLDKITLSGASGPALLILDSDLAKREYKPLAVISKS